MYIFVQKYFTQIVHFGIDNNTCPRKGQMVTRCLSQKDPKKIQPNRTKNLIAKNKVLG